MNCVFVLIVLLVCHVWFEPWTPGSVESCIPAPATVHRASSDPDGSNRQLVIESLGYDALMLFSRSYPALEYY